LSKSFPTPNTQELFFVVTRLAVGAPDPALPVPVAPIAPEPLVPDELTPVKLMTVIDEETLLDSVAVTMTPLNVEGAKARQISAVPFCVLVRFTRAQVNPAPVRPETVVLVPEAASVAINASSSSFPAVVEKLAVFTVELELPWSADIFASIVIPGVAVNT